MDPDLTVVLLGGSGVGKSASGNTLLGEAAFESASSFGPVTTDVSEVTRHRLGRRIKVVDTPEILGHEDRVGTCCQDALRAPGACLFLVVLRTGRFTQAEEKKAVDAAIRVLGEDGVKLSCLLFTGGDRLRSSLDQYVLQSHHRSLTDVLKTFGDRKFLFNNQSQQDSRQVQDLLDKTDHLRTWDQLGLPPLGVTVVLLGNSGSGKSSSGNTILGRAAFESRPSLKPVTTEIREETGRLFGKRISVVDTPGILESEEQVNTWCQNNIESSRPCLFLVVVRVGRFSEQDLKAAEAAIRAVGPRWFENCYLLFTGGDSLKTSSLQHFVYEYEGSSLSGVVRRFGDRIHLFNNEDPGPEQVRELLQKSGPRLLKSLRLVERRVVLLGLSGAGKSSSGNTVLGFDLFTTDCGFDPVASEPVCKSAAVEGRWVTVVDTPGFTSRDADHGPVKEQFCRMRRLSEPGPHVFVFVVRISRTSREDFILIRSLLELFDRAAPKYNMVLFTHGDDLRGRPIDELVRSSPRMSELVSRCQGTYCVFDNSQPGNRLQVRTFLDTVDAMVEANGGRYWAEEARDADDDELDLKHWPLGQNIEEFTFLFCYKFSGTTQCLDAVYKKLNG